ncbi:ADP-ribosylglycohydrolase family protein [Niameybacter massiliensis]|uniref:ADP-ribosylglycohydrolase family protein n=1 Tax=Niameybacter massiliensis TaxID=1658108 RepID=UPI0006B579AC|nr:ADP-ribosylglycohydrolase family protein [Niameybacter massiliensis]
MLTRLDLINNKALAFDKAYGSLSGLAIGDSFGDASRKPENKSNYGVTTDFNKGASWSTDDTEFALLTAKTLIECGGHLTTDEVVKAWLNNVATQDEFKRGGASEIEAANNLRKGLRPPYSGMYNSAHMSDGTAMRIGPVGIICAGDPERAAHMAAIDASVSHYREGVWGAQAVAAAVSVAMVDATMDEIIDTAMLQIPKDSWFYYAMNNAFEIIEKADGSIIDAWMPLHDALWTSSWATTAEAVTQAFACLKLAHQDFKTGVIVAGNFGRDADTIGAVAGTILGAKYGASKMPEAWIEKTRYPSGTCLEFTKGLDIKELATGLATLIK